MDHGLFELSRRLIGCGTILVVAALLLVASQNWLAAGDVQQHRSLASSMLRENGVNRVTLTEWEPPSLALPWTALAGGFAIIAIGIKIGVRAPGSIKGPRGDHFD